MNTVRTDCGKGLSRSNGTFLKLDHIMWSRIRILMSEAEGMLVKKKIKINVFLVFKKMMIQKI